MATEIVNWQDIVDRTAAPNREMIENKLGEYLPTGSYTVIVRNYGGGDARASYDRRKKVSFTVMIMLSPEGKQVALQNRMALEAQGFKVSERGDVSF